MNTEKIKESIRELLYDLEHSKTHKEIEILLSNYIKAYPNRDWEKIDQKFKPALAAERIMNLWANRG